MITNKEFINILNKCNSQISTIAQIPKNKLIGIIPKGLNKPTGSNQIQLPDLLNIGLSIKLNAKTH
jgi:hypothetical protein